MFSLNCFPEGFKNIQVWNDLSSAIDSVFGPELSDAINALAGLRTISVIENNPYIDRETLLLLNDLLGVKTIQTDLLTDTDLTNFIKFSPDFFKEKGSADFLDFISFSINALLNQQFLWTEDYINFYPAGSPGIGTPVWEPGGTWYPTTQVIIQYDYKKFSSSVASNFSTQKAISDFYYSVAPINLVINQFIITINSVTPGYLGFSAAARMRVYSGNT